MPKKPPQEDLIDRILNKTLGEGSLRSWAGVGAWSMLAIILLAIVVIGIPKLESNPYEWGKYKHN